MYKRGGAITELLSDSLVRLDKNPDYWRKGLPYLDRIVVRFINDEATRTAALEKGEAHVAGFGAVESEQRWVELARAGLAALDALPNRGSRPPIDRASFEAALAHAKGLRAAGRTAEAEAAFAALEELFRDDPPALAAVRAARAGK